MNNTEKIKKSLVKRYRKEKRFRAFGLAAVLTAFAFLAILLADRYYAKGAACFPAKLDQAGSELCPRIPGYPT
ncbi:MAG: hypothetical protein DSZ28_04925 [Thiothrix sp.]|nr:MAG: hypothetical protein DSZ28_04925 [Thiothrix sp.]